ncbi:MAG: hypothetical protein HY315_01560 [Acidobacteria bacterium]|nr:hypothetical protein [Acidobacteriota bacterium]
MAGQDSQTHPLEAFVRGYFQDLTQDLQQVRDRLDQLRDRLASRLDGMMREPYLQELSHRLDELVDELARREAAGTRLAAAFGTLTAASEENDVLDALTRHGQAMASRILLLVKRADRWVRFRDGRLEEQTCWKENEPTVFQRAAAERTVIADESSRFPAHRRLHEELGGEAAYCVAIPLVFGDCVPAVLYADAPDHEHLDVTGLEILCQGARLAIRALRAPERHATVERSPAEAAASRHPLPGHPGEETGVSPLQSELPAAPPTEAPVDAVPPASQTGDEGRQHADALRFARLLVSELKLYNEQAVAEGRRRHDLYLRLKQDIDRSRLMYGRRVSPALTRHRDYFHEEVVKLLAEGDAGVLGTEYPGSQALHMQ